MIKNISIYYALFLFCLTTTVEAVDDSVNSLDKSQSTESSTIMPNYGNWCGPNHPENIATADEPIDSLDLICKNHDLCYLEKGYLSCECDADFTNSITIGLRENKFIGKEKVFSHSFRAFFKNSPCEGDHSNKLAPTRAIQNVVNKTGTITKKIIKKVPFVGE